MNWDVAQKLSIIVTIVGFAGTIVINGDVIWRILTNHAPHYIKDRLDRLSPSRASDAQGISRLDRLRASPFLRGAATASLVVALIILGVSIWQNRGEGKESDASATDTSCPLEIMLDQPTEGSAVDLELEVNGHSCGLSVDDAPFLQVFVRPLPHQADQAWHAQQPVELLSDGRWFATAIVGLSTDPEGTEFIICAIATSSREEPGSTTAAQPSGLSDCVTVHRR